MQCFHPLEAWQREDGSVVFEERGGDVLHSLQLRCGQCIGCRLERSRQWAVRCMHESQMYGWSSFITLTYDDEHLPWRGHLNYPDFQKFNKRMRARMGPFSFFMCGEYGGTFGRPHYHSLVFGLFFADRKLFSERSDGVRLYTSETLSSLWPYGHASVGDVTFKSAAYVSRYVCKKIDGDAALDHYLRCDEFGEAYHLTPEFGRMSLKPAIGKRWWEKYQKEVFARGDVIVDGMSQKPPTYYQRNSTDLRWDDIEYRRYLEAEKYAGESTPDRLAAREAVALAKLEFKKRVLE